MIDCPEKEVCLVQVIKTSLTKRGDGTKENPTRTIIQYWTLDGDLLAEFDALLKIKMGFDNAIK